MVVGLEWFDPGWPGIQSTKVRYLVNLILLNRGREMPPNRMVSIVEE